MAQEATLRDTLETTIKQAEETPAVTTPEVTPEIPPTAPPVGQTPESAVKEAVPAAVASPAPTEAPKPEGTPSEAPKTETLAAPTSWRADEKAGWGKIPPEQQKAILRREQETARVLSTTAEARKLSTAFDQMLNPYKPILEKYGVANPLDAIQPLLATRAALEIGTKEQKAQLVSNLIRQFGVDVATLDEYLTNPASVPQVQAPPPPPDFRRVPELAPLFSLADQMNEKAQAQVQAQIDEVATLPHFEELREDMADLLELARNRGANLSVKDAYHRALAVSPYASTATPAAPAQVSTSEAAAILAKSRKAASTVAGAPKSAPGDAPKSLRAQLEAAFGD